MLYYTIILYYLYNIILTLISIFYLGNALKAFGAFNSRVTTPIVTSEASNLLSTELPSDDRESEVLYATGTILITIMWVLLQVYYNYDD